MSNSVEKGSTVVVDVPMEIEAKYVNTGFAPHQVKGKVLPGVYTKEYKDETGEAEKGVITWDLKAFPEMSQIERIRGKFYLMRHGEMIDTAEEFPAEMQELVLWANMYVADNKLLVKEIEVKREPAKEMTNQTAKNEAPSTLPAVINEIPSQAIATTQSTMTVVNHNRIDAIRVNGIAVPNEYIVLYETKSKNGTKITPYIREKGLEFLAGQLGLWTDPRAKDPNFPVENLKPAIDHEVIKYPWSENEMGPKGVCIVKGIVRLANGQIFTDIGTVTPANSNGMQNKYPLEIAITRAKARALRDATHCNVCSLEEADPDDLKQGNIIDAEFTVASNGGGQ